MPTPLRPTSLYSANNWYFEIPGMVSPDFHTLSGISRETGEISVVDGYTNITHKFSNQIKTFGDIILTRAYNGSIDDKFMATLNKLCEDTCFRFDGNLVKMHCGKEVFRILFLGMRIKGVKHPDLATDSTSRYDVQYTLSVSEWYET